MPPKPSFILPDKLMLADLRLLCLKTGVGVSGTKPILAQRITNEINNALSHPKIQTSGAPLRILSIDMGLRNLAFCAIDYPSTDSKDALPKVQAWERLSVSTTPKPIVRYPVPASFLGSNLKHPPKERKDPVENFDALSLSQSAYDVLTRRLLPLQPTHILIEKQRFRSGGGAHVFEWTLRVNMFESIIYAILTTLKEKGIWTGTVEAITPGRIGPFWIGVEKRANENIRANDYKKQSKAKLIKAQNKEKKVDLVRGWLAQGDKLELGNETVIRMAERYNEKWDRKPGEKIKVRKVIPGKGAVVEDAIPKLDDLADSLLQGMAWLEWERNKRLMVEHGGVESLLKMDEKYEKLLSENEIKHLD